MDKTKNTLKHVHISLLKVQTGSELRHAWIPFNYQVNNQRGSSERMLQVWRVTVQIYE
ncbi:Hypothetical predicted protein [Mytilus galloprovincialis]|uniref:Uncharacterized protein n=1 Tax=Mytilus galloprovincialis TaxID=29158 RepID=A0A8B6H1T2_MYTGA|nr:Hypothetical predicted protein [Mytilus galloprovincialis]